jgi:hypothetical protein
VAALAARGRAGKWKNLRLIRVYERKGKAEGLGSAIVLRSK